MKTIIGRIVTELGDYALISVLLSTAFKSFFAQSIYWESMDVYISESKVIKMWLVMMFIAFVIHLCRAVIDEETEIPYWQTVAIALIPTGIFEVAKNMGTHPIVVGIVLTAFIILTFLLIYFNKDLLRRRDEEAKRLKKKITGRVLIFSNMAALSLVILVMIVGKNSTYVGAVEGAERQPTWDSVTKQLDRSLWADYDEQKKLKILQDVVTLECRDKLMCEPVTIHAQQMDENTYGFYEDSINKDNIYINADYLNESSLEDALTTVIHETFHAYCYQCVDAMEEMGKPPKLAYFQQLSEWKNNFENYSEYEDSYEAYRSQPLERDANIYSEKRVEEILEMR